NIRIKPLTYSEAIKERLQELDIDSVDISNVLRYGDVIFSKSNTKLDSCRTYYIEGQHDEADIFFTIANCEYEARLIELETSQ
ncbi:MAG: DUF4258 domain-containing protein, partial [Bacteroidia bacterium]|nr:DUF4258 domain-containing protein [Bacteroidia bacterium]